MWIFSLDGFVSVVQGPRGKLLARARRREDLEMIAALAGDKIRHTPERDYPFRVAVEREALASHVASLVFQIEYPNFKAEVHGDPVRDRVYGRIWEAGLGLQEAGSNG